MSKEIFSNHIGGSSELTILGTIIPGYVPGRFPITYAARLRSHLRLLGALRREGLEGQRAGIYTGPIDALRTLQFVRWTLIDNDRRLLLAVNFDRPLEPYVRRIVDIAGPLLDTILCNCEGFLGRSSDQGFHKFMSFAKENQAPVELFAASQPDVTTDDAEYFLQADKLIRDTRNKCTNLDYDLARLKLKEPWEKLEDNADDPEKKYSVLDQGLNILQALYENQHFYPPLDLNDEESRDDLLYYRLAQGLTPGFWRRQLILIRQKFPKSKLSALLRDADEFDLSDDTIRGINYLINATIARKWPGSRPEEAPYDILHRFQEARNWFGNPPVPRNAYEPALQETDQVQSELRALPPRSDVGKASSPRTEVSCMLLLRIDDMEGGRNFLSEMDPLLWPSPEDDIRWNLSITYRGLKSLGTREQVRLSFPVAFREGMARRAGLLGDIGINNPREWVWPTSNWTSADGVLSKGSEKSVNPETIDLIVQVAKRADGDTSFDEFDTGHPLFELVNSFINKTLPSSVRLLAVEPLQRRYAEGNKQVLGHLGWADGISQPIYRGSSGYDVENTARWTKDDLKPEPDYSPIGDLLIGHPTKNDLLFNKSPDERTDANQLKPLQDYRGSTLANGTFQVVRKLRIDTDSFEKHGTELEKAKMIGRHRDGRPLMNGATDNQDFNYRNDEVGETTPLQSHIRRINPRKADTPRILRRGWSYGPFDTPDKTFPNANRGSFFIAYNANISEQFEVIQRWISGGNSTGIASWHGDPLLAPVRPGGIRTFRHPGATEAEYVELPTRPPATLQWGIYAFTPSQKGLMSLTKGGAIGEEQQITITPPISQRLSVKDADASRDDWKLVLEDVDDERQEERGALWREIRVKKGGVFRAEKYGVLVGSAEAVEQVLFNNKNTYSVRRYWDRMRDTTGVSHVCLDEPPLRTTSEDPAEKNLDAEYNVKVKPGDYTRVRDLVNPFFTKYTEVELLNHSFVQAQACLLNTSEDSRYLPGEEKPIQDGRRMRSERFIYDLVAKLCSFWFGLPDENIDMSGPESDGPHCPHDLIRGSFHVFWPHPSEQTQEAAERRTKALSDEVMNYVQRGRKPNSGTLMHDLNDHPTQPNNTLIANAVTGACLAFAGPTSGSFRAVLYDWIDTGQLWRMQQQLHGAGVFSSNKIAFHQLKQMMESAVLESMALRAAPDLLYRTAVKSDDLGGVKIEAGDTVVFSLSSAAEDDPARKRFFLFGGDYRELPNSHQPQHTCAGQRMALCTIMGALAAIMSFDEIRPEGPLSVRVHGAMPQSRLLG